MIQDEFFYNGDKFKSFLATGKTLLTACNGYWFRHENGGCNAENEIVPACSPSEREDHEYVVFKIIIDGDL